jgi:quercetin dioxygenase-like cupin family protein
VFKKWDDATPVEAAPGAVRRTLAYGERTLLVEWTMDEGGVVQPHAHEYEQIGYLVSGAIDLTVDGQTIHLGPGDGYVALPGTVHSAIARKPSRIIDVFSPVRDDYK